MWLIKLIQIFERLNRHSTSTYFYFVHRGHPEGYCSLTLRIWTPALLSLELGKFGHLQHATTRGCCVTPDEKPTKLSPYL